MSARGRELLLIPAAFRLSETTDQILDDLAHEHGTTRTRAVDVAIRWLARTMEMQGEGELIYRSNGTEKMIEVLI